MHDQVFACAVCAQPARGFHFGAFTCEGCKSFFGRTCLKQNEKTFECKNGGQCNVKGDNRTSCKYCRFQRCIRVGMSPMNSRFGRRSKYFKVSMQNSAAPNSAESTSHPNWSCPTQSNSGQHSSVSIPSNSAQSVLFPMPLLGAQSIFLGQLLLALCQSHPITHKNIV